MNEEHEAHFKRIGEVVESRTIGFTAGTYELLHAPPFGALVRASTHIAGLSVYGLVYDVATTSKEPGGKAMVRGKTYEGKQLYDEEIYREHPDLAEILQTTFSALTVGFRNGTRIVHHLPSHPPPIHYSVYECPADELIAFTETSDFFRAVLFAPQVPADELLAAAIRRAALARGRHGQEYRAMCGNALATILKDDYDRLYALLRLIMLEP